MLPEMDINSIIRDFYKISGFRISIHDLECNEIYSYPQKISPFCGRIQKDNNIRCGCIKCDKAAFQTVKDSQKVHIYKCGCGLYEAVAPIYHYGVLAGYLMMGQVRDGTPENEKYIIKKTSAIFSDRAELERFFKKITVISLEDIYSYINIMIIIAEYLTKYNKLNSRGEDLADLIKKYINKNYAEKVDLEILSSRFGCCKSTVMNVFKKKFGLTVIAYLNEVRLEKARIFISDTDLSFKEISSKCGFYDQNYFSKLFSSKYGCSPTEFRRSLITK